MQEIVPRYLPPPPAAIADVGGGPGTYSCWLAAVGYAVHLVDPMPLLDGFGARKFLISSDAVGHGDAP